MCSLIQNCSDGGENKVIYCTAIDQTITKFPEDGFRLVKYGSDEYRLDIVSIIPDINLINFDKVNLCLKTVIESGNVGNFLFNNDYKTACSLQETKPVSVLIVTYKVKKDGTLTKKLSYGKAIAKRLSHEDFIHASDKQIILNNIKFAVNNILLYEKRLARDLYNHHKKILVDYGESAWVVAILCDMFNHQCRKVAKKINSPYFFIDRRLSKIVSDSYGKFSQPLRCPISLINTINIRQVMEGFPPIVTEKEMSRIII